MESHRWVSVSRVLLKLRSITDGWVSVSYVLQTPTAHHRQMGVCVPCPPKAKVHHRWMGICVLCPRNTYSSSQTDGCLCLMSSKRLWSITDRWTSVSRVLQMLTVHHRQMGVCVTCPPKAKDHHRPMGVCVPCLPNAYGPSQTDGRLCPVSS